MAIQSDDHMGLAGKRPRLMIDISPDLRRRIKMAAAEKDLSINEYIGRILEQAIPHETKLIRRHGRLNSEAVEDLLRTSEEIMLAHPDQVFEDSSDTLHQIREERLKELEQL